MVSEQKMSLNRERCDFTKSHPCDLNLVSQRLRQADENTPIFNQEQQVLTQLKQVFRQLGVIFLTPEGQVQFVTQRGEQLLSQYFSCSASHSLPEPLQNWFKHQISLLTSKDQVSSPCLPLQIEQAGKQLLVRLISNLIGEQYFVLLEEQKLQSLSLVFYHL